MRDTLADRTGDRGRRRPATETDRIVLEERIVSAVVALAATDGARAVRARTKRPERDERIAA